MKPLYEKIGPDAGRSFFCRRFAGRAFDCPFHFHPECELTHIVRSRGLRFTGDHIGEFGPGDLVLFGAHLPHSYHNDPAHHRPATGARSHFVQFAPDCLGGILQHAPELRPVRQLIERSSRGLLFTGQTRTLALGRLDALFAADAADRIPCFLELLLLLARSRHVRPLASRGYTPARLAESDPRIGRVCAHINRHFAEPLYLESVAALAHLSPAAFCRFFRRATGKTFTAFVNEIRLSQAARLLQETTLGVTEICFRSGYGNLANFNRHFRRLHHLSPREYRQRQHATAPTEVSPRFISSPEVETAPRRSGYQPQASSAPINLQLGGKRPRRRPTAF